MYMSCKYVTAIKENESDIARGRGIGGAGRRKGRKDVIIL